MLYPSINEIKHKADSRYTLVILAAKRARDIVDGKPALVECKVNKPVSIAAREINEDLIKVRYPEDKPEEADTEEAEAAEEAPAEETEADTEEAETAEEAPAEETEADTEEAETAEEVPAEEAEADAEEAETAEEAAEETEE